jgi:outer membrane protein assembly factor BamD
MKRGALALLLVVVAGCSARNTDKRFFDEVTALSKEEIMERGDALLEDKKYTEARRYFGFLADSFPNDPLGRQAALRVADAYYRGRDLESLTEARLRYRDFVNRFPNDPSRAYALLMLGKCSYQQGKGPLRDLTPVKEAADSFKQVVELFPDSPHTAEAKELYSACLDDLSRHELLVAEYYMNVGAWRGARLRLEYLVEKYPTTKAGEEGARMLRELADKGLTAVSAPSPPESATP